MDGAIYLCISADRPHPAPPIQMDDLTLDLDMEALATQWQPTDDDLGDSHDLGGLARCGALAVCCCVRCIEFARSVHL